MKNKLYKTWIKSKNINDLNIYKNYKRIFNQIVTDAKYSYYNRIFSNDKSNTKCMWKEINKICNPTKVKCKNTKIKQLNSDNNVFTDSQEIAEHLNNFFT